MTPEELAARKWALETEIEILKNRLLDGPTLKVLGKRIEELEELLEDKKRK
tara:strand:+ start:637 stop:789 length:153 start_codon:yes stop_codon:yes gene_type:complete